MPRKKIDATFVHHLFHDVNWRPAYQYVRDVVPIVLFEVLALGPEAQIVVGTRAVKLRLQDGLYYKLKYDHETHTLSLYRMIGAKANGPVVARWANGTLPEEVRHYLRPAVQ